MPYGENCISDLKQREGGWVDAYMARLIVLEQNRGLEGTTRIDWDTRSYAAQAESELARATAEQSLEGRFDGAMRMPDDVGGAFW